MENFRSANLRIALIFILTTAVFLLSATRTMSQELPSNRQMVNDDSSFKKFSQSSEQITYQIDYSELDSFLNSIVVNFGPSERQVSYGLGKITGSRARYGHYGKTALEGNRILFSLFTKQNEQRATYLRMYMETLSELIEFDKLTKDQQLAFWLNIYNITVIEQIAKKYPVQYPKRIKIGDDNVPMFDAKLVRVDGVLLSLNEIQQKIVYTNWKNSKVIYGFFGGAAGGPNIRAFSYTQDQVWKQLDSNAKEFVNSLRGVRKEGNRLLVSAIYENSNSYFNDDTNGLRKHLRQFAEPPVLNLLSQNIPLETAKFYGRIADLSGGQSATATMMSVVSVGITQDGPVLPLGTGRTLPPHARQLMFALKNKYRRLERKGITSVITIIDQPTLNEILESTEEQAPEINATEQLENNNQSDTSNGSETINQQQKAEE